MLLFFFFCTLSVAYTAGKQNIFKTLPGLLLFPERVAASKPTSEDHWIFFSPLGSYFAGKPAENGQHKNTILHNPLSGFFGPYKLIWAVSLLTKDLLIWSLTLVQIFFKVPAADFYLQKLAESTY
jgi:hypothetical protein